LRIIFIKITYQVNLNEILKQPPDKRELLDNYRNSN